MKLLAIILTIVLLMLLAVCFFLPRNDDQTVTEPTPTHTTSATLKATEPTQPRPTQTDPPVTQPSQPQATQPSETQPAPEPEDTDFVRISDYIPDVRVELAYATADNFTGTQIYEFTDAFLRYGTVKKLAAVAQTLRQSGYGILVWDGYRPVYAQQMLWDICPNPTYVSKPGTGTQAHCRGTAVDISLYDLQTGEKLEMPSGFDEFSALGDRDYSDCTQSARKNAELLEDVMVQCGFKPYSGEWWHFSDNDFYDIEYVFDPALIN